MKLQIFKHHKNKIINTKDKNRIKVEIDFKWVTIVTIFSGLNQPSAQSVK